jgi:adenylosuccinate lyase
MTKESLLSISPIDGRYKNKIKELENYFSEFALIKTRVEVEIKWLLFLSNTKSFKFLPSINKNQQKKIESILTNFNLKEASKVKSIEKITNHDVKAVEIYIAKQLDLVGLSKLNEFVHICCTSEDINNLSYALMVERYRTEYLLPNLKSLNKEINKLAVKWANISMLSFTHGQKASPTSLGKEFKNFFHRICFHLNKINESKQSAKFNGAVGNFNAHQILDPEINWPKITNKFISSFNLEYSLISSQIEFKDNLVFLLSNVENLNNVLLDLSKDIWLYISKDYLKQKISLTEVGSSTMPHKVNPIDFENAEGNLSLSNSLIPTIKNKLQISRLQRDLSDSTVSRNIGLCFAYLEISLSSLNKGLIKLEPNKTKIKEELLESWEVLAEAIQTVMRKNKISNSYDIIKRLTRGNELSEKSYINLIENLPIEEVDKTKLLKLSPIQYIGLASYLAKLK